MAIPGEFATPNFKSQTARNIRAICALEQEALNRRSAGERIGDFVSLHAGRMWFILLHATLFTGWIIVNTGHIGIKSFDPYPYPALMAFTSLEAIFLSLFVLMSQNRSSKRADERSHLDLQINLLAEHEMTKMLSMLQALCAHHKLTEANDPELAALLEQTRPEILAKELESQLPSESASKPTR
jgi:uncharacterized membrane protein